MHGNVRGQHAVRSAGLLAGEVGLETAHDDSVFRAAQRELVGTLVGVQFGAEEIGEETAEIAPIRVFAKLIPGIIYGLPTANISPEVINTIGMTWDFAQKP